MDLVVVWIKKIRNIDVFYPGEHFKIQINSNAPGMIEEGLERLVKEWLTKQGSTAYFTAGKRDFLELKLKIVREAVLETTD